MVGNAIRHDDLRPHLYNQARALGTFREPSVFKSR